MYFRTERTLESYSYWVGEISANGENSVPLFYLHSLRGSERKNHNEI